MLPDSITAIEGNPFRYCPTLQQVMVSPYHTVLATIDNVLFDKREKRLIWYPMTRKDAAYEIPEGVAIIGDAAFSRCTSLTRVTLPGSITAIGALAFDYCTGLTGITIPDGVISIGDGAFTSCTRLTQVALPNSTMEIGANPFQRCTALQSVSVRLDHPSLVVVDDVLF